MKIFIGCSSSNEMPNKYREDCKILLDEIFIEEEYRIKGIGTRVIKEIINELNTNIYLWVYKENAKASKLYGVF